MWNINGLNGHRKTSDKRSDFAAGIYLSQVDYTIF